MKMKNMRNFSLYAPNYFIQHNPDLQPGGATALTQWNPNESKRFETPKR